MKNSDREVQIMRIQSTSFQPELSTALAAKLRQAVVGVTKATLEAALVEELLAERWSPKRSSGATLRLLYAGTRHRVWSHRKAPSTEAEEW